MAAIAVNPPGADICTQYPTAASFSHSEPSPVTPNTTGSPVASFVALMKVKPPGCEISSQPVPANGGSFSHRAPSC